MKFTSYLAIYFFARLATMVNRIHSTTGAQEPDAKWVWWISASFALLARSNLEVSQHQENQGDFAIASQMCSRKSFWTYAKLSQQGVATKTVFSTRLLGEALQRSWGGFAKVQL
ncbi:hypothetical protein ACO0LF_10130 [Undibacterium sp. Di27W]